MSDYDDYLNGRQRFFDPPYELECQDTTPLPEQPKVGDKVEWSFGCFICGNPSTEYAALPNGDVVQVCSEHVCEHGHVISNPAYDDKQMKWIRDTINTNCNSHYLTFLKNELLCLLYDWESPCVTCRTTY